MERETIVEGVPGDSVELEAVPVKKADASLQGSILVLIQFDVAEEIRLDELRKIFSARTAGASFKHPAPGYVQYQRPPVVEPVEALVLDTGERLDGQIKYYDYGVLSVVFELPFAGEWEDLIRLSGRWVWDTDFAALASRIVKKRLERARPALIKPYANWLHEDYFIFHVRDKVGKPFRQRDLEIARGSDRPDCARRDLAAFRWRAPGNSARTDLLLPKRSDRNRLECGVSVRFSLGRGDSDSIARVRQLPAA